MLVIVEQQYWWLFSSTLQEHDIIDVLIKSVSGRATAISSEERLRSYRSLGFRTLLRSSKYLSVEADLDF